MNIDPNKIISVFSDCRGTCKTPIGCTCGKEIKTEEETEVEVVHQEIKIDKLTIVEAIESESFLKHNNYGNSKICSCGKSETGFCNCRAKNSREGGVACCSGTNKLEVYNWLQNMPDVMVESQMVEVQFKNTRKEYFVNSNNIDLRKGDVVAVEASPGHDIGEVTLTGKLVELQMKKVNYRNDIRRVYRIAKPSDLEKYKETKAREHKTMLRAREIAEELNLDMKISDVEFQGDGNKSIFYYIADGRVDFRQLIKHYALEFRIKIEMKQIGARQEAGRVGGIGPCGRELCCSSSMSNFVSVSTQAARLQDIPLNPQKLAGQCGKLKCCLNFEVDTYVEAQKKLPPRDIILETKDSAFYHFKTDILAGEITYSTDKYIAANLVTISRDRVFEIIKQNKGGKKPMTLIDHDFTSVESATTVHDVLQQESITRFDDAGEKKNSNRRNRQRRNNKQVQAQEGNNEQQRSRKNNINRGNNNTENTQPTSDSDSQQRSTRRRNSRKNNRNKQDITKPGQAQATIKQQNEKNNKKPNE